MRETEWRLDQAAHELHHGDQVFPCDRNVEAFAVWESCALLLSSDTDCLSLWDADGLIRTIRVGVYPQDMVISSDHAIVCGGCDGLLYMIKLPELQVSTVFSLPGMPERITLQDHTAWILTLITDPEIQTLLLTVDLTSGVYHEIAHISGIPGALLTDRSGLWVAASEVLMHLPYHASTADVMIHGFGLIQRIEQCSDGLLLHDPLAGAACLLRLDRSKHWSLCPADT